MCCRLDGIETIPGILEDITDLQNNLIKLEKALRDESEPRIRKLWEEIYFSQLEDIMYDIGNELLGE